MAPPSHLDTSVVWDSILSTETQDAIDMIHTALTATLPAADRWTDLGGGLYESPTQDPGGANRKMSLQITVQSAEYMNWVVKDASGTTIHSGRVGRFNFAGVEVKLSAGPRHVLLQTKYFNTVDTWQTAAAVMCDPFPVDLLAAPTYVAAKTSFDASGVVVTNYNHPDNWVMRDNVGVSTFDKRLAMLFVSTSPDGLTSGGSHFHVACEMITQPTSASFYANCGKLTQFAFVSQQHPIGAVIEIPIGDDGEVGEFEVLGLVPCSTVGAGFHGRLAVRRSF